MAKYLSSVILTIYLCGIINSGFAEENAPISWGTHLKCCEKGQILDIKTADCLVIEGSGAGSNLSVINKIRYAVETVQNSKLVYGKIGFPNCPEWFLMDESISILDDGSLTIHQPNSNHIYGPGQYCLEISTRDWKSYVAIICDTSMSSNATEDAVMNRPVMEWRLSALAILLSISAVFLYLTVVVHLVLWKRQNIHHWLQFAYIVTLFLAFMFLAFVQSAARRVWTVSCSQLMIFGALSHYAVLSSFTWLTSMNFDIWWTIGRSPLKSCSQPNSVKLKFLGYSIFGFGIPFILAFDQFYRNFSQGVFDAETQGLTTRLTCSFFADVNTQFKYMYGPITALLLINVILIFRTTYNLNRETKAISTDLNLDGSKTHKKKRVKLFLKLFVLMGLTSIFEVVGWFIQIVFAYKSQGLFYLFFATDCLNACKGILIFVVFVCKDNMSKKLSTKIRRLFTDVFPRIVTLTKPSSVNTTTPSIEP